MKPSVVSCYYCEVLDNTHFSAGPCGWRFYSFTLIKTTVHDVRYGFDEPVAVTLKYVLCFHQISISLCLVQQNMHNPSWEESWARSIRDPPLNLKREKKQATQTWIPTTLQCRKCTTPMRNRCPSRGLNTQPRSSWTCQGTPQPQLVCPPRLLSKQQGTNLLPL